MPRKQIRQFTLLLIGLFLTINVHAQQTIPASGGNASGTGGSVSYSVGQIFITTNTGTNGSVAEGVQQPYEISVVTGIGQARDINLKCTAYPNPATDLLTLEVDISDNENLFFHLYDMMGKLLVSKKLIEIRTSITMSNLAPSTYFLKVTDNNKVVKTFKIIKIK